MAISNATADVQLDHGATGAAVQVEVHADADAAAQVTKNKARATRSKMVSVLAMFRFAAYFDWLLMFIGAICAAANGATLAAFSVILGNLLDVLNSPDPSKASDIAVIFVWIGLGAFAGGTCQVGLFTATSERMTIKLRQRYLNALLAQDISFFDGQDAGKLTATVAENAIMFREALGDKFAAIFQFTAMFLGGIVVGLLYLWQLCLVILALSPLLGLAGWFMGKALNDIVSGQLESYASAGAIADETVALIRTVTSFGLQRKKVAEYEAELESAARQTTKQGHAMGLGFGAVMLIFLGSYGLAFWVGAVLVTNSKNAAEVTYPLVPGQPEDFCRVGHVIPANCSLQVKPNSTFETAADVCSCAFCKCGCYYTTGEPIFTSTICVSGGDVMLTFFAVLIGSFSIGQAAPSFSAFANGRTAAAALFEVIDRAPAIDAESEEGLKPTQIQGDIKFINVAFRYPSRPDAPVFTKLNLSVPGGKRVALVGESGSGKSTCIALLERYYDPLEGSITLDGNDLRQLNVKHLRSIMGLVAQEPILFGTTVRENVRFGRPGAADAEVEQACKSANAHGFITEFPAGYNTFVSSSLVSGGQKQRLAIARALLRNPPILLLDEATAALDNESERLVNDAIDRLLNSSGSRTTIVIAHRLTSIKACDHIIVLEKGQVVEEGTHTSLIERNGLYASLTKLSEGGERGGKSKIAVNAQESNMRMKLPEFQPSPSSDEVVIKLSDGAPADSSSFALPKPSGNAYSEASSKGITNSDETPEDELEEEEQISTGCCGRKKSIKIKKKEKTYPIRKAFIYAYPERFYFIPAIVAASVNGLTFPIFALLFANLIDSFFIINSSEFMNTAARWCGAFAGLAIGNALAVYFQNLTFQFINGQMTKRVRSAVFSHIISQEMGFFDEKHNSVGVLTAKLASDAAMVRAAVSDRLAVATMNVATMIAGLTIAFIASWQVSLVVFALFPAIAIGGAIEFMVMSGLAGSDQKALEVAGHTLAESVSGVRTVSAFNMQPSIKKLYLSQLQGPLKKSIRKGAIAGVGFGFSQGIMFFAYALAFWYGSRLVADGTISFKDLNQSLFGILMTAMAMGQNVAVAPDLGKGQSAVNSIFRLLARKSKIDPFDQRGQKPSSLIGDVKFEDIEFAYPTRPHVTVLQGFNLEVKRGQTVAFVGTSGSGKSTLVLLLERFYDPLRGSVKIDGIDVRELNVAWLRSQIGIVSQEPALFKGTVMENIRAGRTEATDEDVFEAARMANAHDFISAFAQGYNTEIQTAAGVSGGQKQRIAIARALIRKPTILLLDEATSALDEESQKLVQEALNKLLQQASRTTFVVAHRLSTIRTADFIVVLQNGVVVEQGTYQDLAGKQGGAFQSLLQAQARIHGE